MSNNAPITYQSVAKTCNQMRVLGEKPSVRKIRDRIGGSFTTIAEHLKKWREESQMAASTDLDISQELKQALLAEFSEITNTVKFAMNATIDECKSDLQDAHLAISTYEIQINKLELQTHELKTTLHNNHIEFEKKLAASESTVAFLKDREIQLQEKITEINEKFHQSELLAAISNTKSENFQNKIRELEQSSKSKK